MTINKIINKDAIEALKSIDDKSIDLIYTDPPFGTQNAQTSLRKLKGEVVSVESYDDKQDDYMAFIMPHLIEFNRILKDNGTLYIHLDYRWVHYVKVELDKIFGRKSFLNEIVWSYNFGGRGKNCWPKKHDTILVYVKNPNDYVFNWDDIDRIPYAAPELQYAGRTKEEAQKRIENGQVPTDVWEMSIVGTNSKERVGYPNQKPLKLLKRVISASSPKGGTVLDCFCGSGTTGVAAFELERNFVLIDKNEAAICKTVERLNELNARFVKQ